MSFSDVYIVNGSNMDRPSEMPENWSRRSLYVFEIIRPSMDKFEEDFTTRTYCRIPLELTIQIHDFPLNLLNLEPMPNPNSKRKHIHYEYLYSIK